VGILLAAILVFCTFLIHEPSFILVVIFLLVVSILTFTLFRKNEKIINATARSFLIAMLVYGYVNIYLYPFLFRYQSGSVAARYLNTVRPATIVYIPENGPASYSLEFYLKQPVRLVSMDSLRSELKEHKAAAFMPRSMYDSISIRGYQLKEVREFKHFHISQLTLDFLNCKTRENTVTSFVLAE